MAAHLPEWPFCKTSLLLISNFKPSALLPKSFTLLGNDGNDNKLGNSLTHQEKLHDCVCEIMSVQK